MSKNESIGEDMPGHRQTREPAAGEPANHQRLGDSKLGVEPSAHAAAPGDGPASSKSSGSDERDAGKSNQLDPFPFPPNDLERLQRIMSAPWLQSFAASNLHAPNSGISNQMLESINRMRKAAAPDVSLMSKSLEKTIWSLSQSELLNPVSAALTKWLETSLRQATLAGFATSTQQWLTTTDALRYRNNSYVWHYTNGYACLSIIKSGHLWASSPESLNDASEMTHGLSVIRDSFEKVMNETKEEENYDPGEWETVELLLNEVLDAAYFDTILNEVYYISASSQPDSLTLWRNYANGDGFALGLSTKIELSADGIALDDDEHTDSLRDDIPPISSWYRVTYKKKQKERLATEFIQNAIEDIDRAGQSDHDALVKELRKQAVILASVMKHDAFEDEKEVRWITTNFTNFDPVHYEHGRRSIVPVLHVRTAHQDTESLLPIRGVRCSPVAPDGIVRTIHGLLSQENYKQAANNVEKSKQPFKG